MAGKLLARGCWWIGLGVVLLVGTAFTPIANELARALRPQTTVRPADAIVVLGAAANPDGTLNPASLVRFVEGTALYRQHLAPVVIYSGLPLETATRVRLAEIFGVPASAIIEESRGQTTADEARLIVEHLRARAARRILLVTNSMHLARASHLFARAGLDVVPVPANDLSEASGKPEDRLTLLRVVVQELSARLYYRLAGRY